MYVRMFFEPHSVCSINELAIAHHILIHITISHYRIELNTNKDVYANSIIRNLFGNQMNGTFPGTEYNLLTSASVYVLSIPSYLDENEREREEKKFIKYSFEKNKLGGL